MKWSLMTYTVSSGFPGGLHSLEAMGDFARELGFEALELSAGNLGERAVHEFGDICHDRGLAVSCINGGCNLADVDDSEFAQGLDQAHYYVDMAVELSCPAIMLIAGQAQSEKDKPRATERIASGLSQVIAYAQPQGIAVTVEDFPNLLTPYCSISEVRTLMDMVPDLKLTYDNGNWMIGGDDPLLALTLFEGKIANVHLKDWEETTAELGRQWSNGKYYRGGRHGKGLIDQRAILAELKRQNYDGYLAFEYEGPVDHTQATLEGITYLRNVMAEL
jgi:sugar phosphate isomerase/epimerase